MNFYRRFIRRNWHSCRVFLGLRPKLFYPLFLLKRKNKYNQSLAICRDTQLVIEAYPRSGNTFAAAAFYCSQNENIKIAHHLHIPAQFIQAYKWRVPTLVIIRHPKYAILSYLQRHPELDEKNCIKEYIVFYSSLIRFKEDIVIAKFEDVTTDFGKVIELVNKKFNTKFELFDHNEKNVKDVFSLIEKVNNEGGAGLASQLAYPSEDKKLERKKIENNSFKSIKARNMLNDAVKLYDKIISLI